MALVTPVDTVPLEQLGRVHFVGIGGAGMSGIARIMLARGVAVSGSDSGSPGVLSELAALGADVHAGHAAAHLGGADTLVVSTAIRPGNPELAEAHRRGLRVLHRAAALAAVMAASGRSAVAGTHGKTTTTSMITTILRECGADPGYVIGGVLAETGLGADDGARPGPSWPRPTRATARSSAVPVRRGDHQRRGRPPGQLLRPGRDPGHLRGLRPPYRPRRPADALRRPPGHPRVAEPPRGLPIRVRSYGTSPAADYLVTGVRRAAWASRSRSRRRLPRPDAGRCAGPSARRSRPAQRAQRRRRASPPRSSSARRWPPAAAGASAYRGAQRRLEPKGEAAGVRVLDSYAHHPTELTADLRGGARSSPTAAGVIAVFQPHLYSRTRIFAAEFGAALGSPTGPSCWTCTRPGRTRSPA